MSTATSPFGPITLVLCCNECGKEIYVKEAPKKCPSCGKPFKHGWDALGVFHS